jgi:predicted ABC-type transport system involved in lysophospholipase L1 biosynthesis ATPase subunit
VLLPLRAICTVLTSLRDWDCRSWAAQYSGLALSSATSTIRGVAVANCPGRASAPALAERVRQARSESSAARLDRLPPGHARTHSGGQRQALAIARTMSYSSKCLILDKPTASVANDILIPPQVSVAGAFFAGQVSAEGAMVLVAR